MVNSHHGDRRGSFTSIPAVLEDVKNENETSFHEEECDVDAVIIGGAVQDDNNTSTILERLSSHQHGDNNRRASFTEMLTSSHHGGDRRGSFASVPTEEDDEEEPSFHEHSEQSFKEDEDDCHPVAARDRTATVDTLETESSHPVTRRVSFASETIEEEEQSCEEEETHQEEPTTKDIFCKALGLLTVIAAVIWVPVVWIIISYEHPDKSDQDPYNPYFLCGISGDYGFLPDYTRNNICQHPGPNPEATAFHWVQDHPDFDSMPLWRKQQLLAVTTLYVSATGELPPGPDECEWEDFQPFCSPLGEYQALSPRRFFDSMNTNWTLPPEISLLTSLKAIDMQLGGGAIPTFLGQLTALSSLLLDSGMDLKGTIPSQLGQLSALQYLHLDSNYLTGPIPSELGLLEQLQELVLMRNRLSGPLPSELWKLTTLVELQLSSNQFTGSLSTQVGELSALVLLDLWHNQFTGTLPSQLGRLSSFDNLWLGDNQFRGSVPSTLAKLTNMKRLQMHHNAMLSGKIPNDMCSFEPLEEVWIDCNAIDCNCSQCECHNSG